MVASPGIPPSSVQKGTGVKKGGAGRNERGLSELYMEAGIQTKVELERHQCMGRGNPIKLFSSVSAQGIHKSLQAADSVGL